MEEDGGVEGRRSLPFRVTRPPDRELPLLCVVTTAVQDSGLMYEKGAPLRCTAAILQ